MAGQRDGKVGRMPLSSLLFDFFGRNLVYRATSAHICLMGSENVAEPANDGVSQQRRTTSCVLEAFRALPPPPTNTFTLL